MLLLKVINPILSLKNGNRSMTGKTMKFLESHEGEVPSSFVEESTWRKENASWLRWSRQLAITLIGYMQDNGMKRADLASKLGVSHIEGVCIQRKIFSRSQPRELSLWTSGG